MLWKNAITNFSSHQLEIQTWMIYCIKNRVWRKPFTSRILARTKWLGTRLRFMYIFEKRKNFPISLLWIWQNFAILSHRHITTHCLYWLISTFCLFLFNFSPIPLWKLIARKEISEIKCYTWHLITLGEWASYVALHRLLSKAWLAKLIRCKNVKLELKVCCFETSKS